MYMDYGHMNMFHGMGMLFWFVMFIIIVMLAMNYFKRNEKNDFKIEKDSALDILKKRYAKGEISKEEFEEIKEQIV